MGGRKPGKRKPIEFNGEVIPIVPRSCLRCDTKFSAVGKFQRLCEDCRQYANSGAVGIGNYKAHF